MASNVGSQSFYIGPWLSQINYFGLLFATMWDIVNGNDNGISHNGPPSTLVSAQRAFPNGLTTIVYEFT